jgi:hypothetical protein
LRVIELEQRERETNIARLDRVKTTSQLKHITNRPAFIAVIASTYNIFQVEQAFVSQLRAMTAALVAVQAARKWWLPGYRKASTRTMHTPSSVHLDQ